MNYCIVLKTWIFGVEKVSCSEHQVTWKCVRRVKHGRKGQVESKPYSLQIALSGRTSVAVGV